MLEDKWPGLLKLFLRDFFKKGTAGIRSRRIPPQLNHGEQLAPQEIMRTDTVERTFLRLTPAAQELHEGENLLWGKARRPITRSVLPRSEQNP